MSAASAQNPTDPYGSLRAAQLQPFAQCITGSLAAAAVAVFSLQPEEAVRNALAATAKRFGYEPDACCAVDVSGLDPDQAFTLLEALDPLLLIAVDAAAVESLAYAYHAQVPVEGNAHLLGRPLACLPNFKAQLGSQEGKRASWKILKEAFSELE